MASHATTSNAASACRARWQQLPSTGIGTSTSRTSVFQAFEAQLPARRIDAAFMQVRAARTAAPIRFGASANAVLHPSPESFGAPAAWRIDIAHAQLMGQPDAPSSCTVKHLLWTVNERLLVGTARRAPNTS